MKAMTGCKHLGHRGRAGAAERAKSVGFAAPEVDADSFAECFETWDSAKTVLEVPWQASKAVGYADPCILIADDSSWSQELSAMLRELQFQEPEEWEATQLPGELEHQTKHLTYMFPVCRFSLQLIIYIP